jgi:AcrR family transcriptional regulator
MAEKMDRRVKYTKMVLKQSLLNLMRDKPIEKITVKDICEKADINRGTFYAHYKDPSNLLAQIENELFDEINSSVESSLNAESISGLLNEIFVSIRKNIDLCRVLFSDYGDKVFVRRIMNIARERSITEWKKVIPSTKDEQLERLYTFYASGCVAIVQDWFQNGMKESPQELSDFIEKISFHGLRAFK